MIQLIYCDPFVKMYIFCDGSFSKYITAAGLLSNKEFIKFHHSDSCPSRVTHS